MNAPSSSEPVAWLARDDGSVIVGRGRMTPSATPPADGVAFFVQNFDRIGERPWWIPEQCQTMTLAEFSSSHPFEKALECSWQALDTSPFSEIFQEIMSSIHGGLFEKTVPVVTEVGSCTEEPRNALIASMARMTPPLQTYGFSLDHTGFAGATPEVLLSMDRNQLRTMALAGTARSEDRGVFAVDEKEIREHEYVAQTLVSKLMDLGELERDSRQILDLGPIVHFLTRIQVKLDRKASPIDMLRRLHPTPALGPLPRTHLTMDKLLDWRHRLNCPPGFGAPFGLWDHGRFDAVVAIRGVWWDRQALQIPAGCGLIEASRLVNEWRELRLKREAVKGFLKPSS